MGKRKVFNGYVVSAEIGDLWAEIEGVRFYEARVVYSDGSFRDGHMRESHFKRLEKRLAAGHKPKKIGMASYNFRLKIQDGQTAVWRNTRWCT